MAKVKTEKRGRRPKQEWIEGTAPPSIPVLDDAAATYYEAMTDRVQASSLENQAKDNLIDKMKENGVDRYESSDGLVVTLTATSNCKVKRKKDAEENGEAE